MKQVVLAREHNAVDDYLGGYDKHHNDAEYQKRQSRIDPAEQPGDAINIK
jgi:hypothetical protein